MPAMTTTTSTVILEGIVGSTAYGMATPESDIDHLGVFVFPTTHVLSLDFRRSQETKSCNGNPDKIVRPDQALHEVAKYLSLALEMNPTVTELLWLPEHTVHTVDGDALIAIRTHLLSAVARAKYGGYCYAQVERLRTRNDGSFSSDTRKRTAKHARHIARLLIQGRQLLTTGELTVRLTDDEVAACRRWGDMAVDDIPSFLQVAIPQIDKLRALPTDLPEHPNRDAANDVLLTIRKNHFT